MIKRIVLVTLVSCFVPQPVEAQYYVAHQVGYSAVPVARLAPTYASPYVTTSRGYPYGIPVATSQTSYMYGAPTMSVGTPVSTHSLLSSYGAPVFSTQQVYSYPTNSVYSYGSPVLQTQVVHPSNVVQIHSGLTYGAPVVHQVHPTQTYGNPAVYWNSSSYGYRSY